MPHNNRTAGTPYTLARIKWNYIVRFVVSEIVTKFKWNSWQVYGNQFNANNKRIMNIILALGTVNLKCRMTTLVLLMSGAGALSYLFLNWLRECFLRILAYLDTSHKQRSQRSWRCQATTNDVNAHTRTQWSSPISLRNLHRTSMQFVKWDERKIP